MIIWIVLMFWSFFMFSWNNCGFMQSHSGNSKAEKVSHPAESWKMETAVFILLYFNNVFHSYFVLAMSGLSNVGDYCNKCFLMDVKHPFLDVIQPGCLSSSNTSQVLYFVLQYYPQSLVAGSSRSRWHHSMKMFNIVLFKWVFIKHFFFQSHYLVTKQPMKPSNSSMDSYFKGFHMLHRDTFWESILQCHKTVLTRPGIQQFPA